MDNITVKQAEDKRGISERWVHKLLQDNRIEGAARFGKSWMIPKGAQTPVDLSKIRRERGEPYHTGKKGGGGH